MKTHKIQPIHQWDEGLFNSYSNKLIDLDNPTPESIALIDIATGLSNVCRFGGQIHTHHSVAKHTLLVRFIAPDHLKRAALLHDAAEAYLGDVIKPLKEVIGESYKAIERRFEAVIFEKYRVDLEDLKELKQYDCRALELEDNYFRYGNNELVQIFKLMPQPMILFDDSLANRVLLKQLLSEFSIVH